MSYDVFISYASEDKDVIAEPLAEYLTLLGYSVWYDAAILKVGDSLRRTIDDGLKSCRYGVVILSKAFFAKNWPQYELDSLVARENASGQKVILPIWHEISYSDVASYSPALSDRVALVSTLGIVALGTGIGRVIGSPVESAETLIIPPDSTKDTGWDRTCPSCGQNGLKFGYSGMGGDEFIKCSLCGYFKAGLPISNRPVELEM